MILRLLFCVSALVVSGSTFAEAEPPVFCSGTANNMSGSNDCISTCSAVASNPTSRLGAGADGMCHGTATYRKFSVYSLGLGQHVLGTNEPVCEIFDGVVEVTTYGQEATFSGGRAVDLTSCPPGVYDLFFITSSRYEAFVAETVFPDGSGKVIKTTSVFANPNTADDFSDQTLFTETGTGFSDNSKGYMRPSVGYSNIYLKLGSTPTSADMSSLTGSIMFYDWMKSLGVGSTSIRPGWYCEDITVCDRLNPLDNNRLDSVWNSDVDVVTGLPVTIPEGAETMKIIMNYYKTQRDDNEELGARFVWHNDGGTVKALGVNPGDSGIYVEVFSPIVGSD